MESRLSTMLAGGLGAQLAPRYPRNSFILILLVVCRFDECQKQWHRVHVTRVSIVLLYGTTVNGDDAGMFKLVTSHSLLQARLTQM